ncbi:MAG: hypothetical protein WB902_26455 [Acetobacteraceae bacterium]
MSGGTCIRRMPARKPYQTINQDAAGRCRILAEVENNNLFFCHNLPFWGNLFHDGRTIAATPAATIAF